MDRGALARIDPHHLIFMIWASPRHYADFNVQIRALLGEKTGDGAHFDTA